MYFENIGSVELLGAQLTLIWPLSCVDSAVRFEMLTLVENLGTELTFVFPFSCAFSAVMFKLFMLSKCLGISIPQILCPRSSVRPLMPLHGPYTTKICPTVVTFNSVFLLLSRQM